MTILKNASIIFVILAAIDYVWLGIVMKSFYVKELAPIGRIVNGSLSPNLIAGVLTYVVMSIGFAVFIVPKIQEMGLLATFGWGALFGLVLYGTYDLTNYTTLASWTVRLVVVDIVWGAFLSGLIAVIARLIGLRA